jgi:hypothetical protein
MRWWQEVARDSAVALTVSGLVAATIKAEAHPHLDPALYSTPLMPTLPVTGATFGSAHWAGAISAANIGSAIYRIPFRGGG